MFDLVLSITVLAAFILLGGAIWQWRRGVNRKQAVLMAIMSLVLICNVLIWALPMDGQQGGGAAREATAAIPN